MFSLDKLANALVLVLLIEMMLATGMGVSVADLKRVIRDGSLLARTLFANYIVVPGIAIALLYLFRAKPLVAAGFLLIAACPGAPFAPRWYGWRMEIPRCPSA